MTTNLAKVAQLALSGLLSDEEVQAAWVGAHAHQRAAGRAKSAPKSRDRSASQERRRRVAAAGWLPPSLAFHFTLGEIAVLGIVASRIYRDGHCDLCNGAIAALAGVSVSLAKQAVRRAVWLGLIDRQERRLRRDRSLPSILTVASAEWAAWLRLRPAGGVRAGGGGGKNLATTKQDIFISSLSLDEIPKSGQRYGRASPHFTRQHRTKSSR